MSGGQAPAGSKWRLYVGIAALVLAAIFILQNSQKVAVKFFFSETQTPLIFALLLVGLLGFVIGLALPRFRRPRD
ncbi:MAG: lipopolysaccharide assembly protein LapA domain-containing protein [Solirubrobacterales bacterium]